MSGKVKINVIIILVLKRVATVKTHVLILYYLC